jgi:NADH:ubiquinone oxidoreductase subunit C
MNSLFIKNIQNLTKMCPLEKIQIYGQELVIVVKSKLLVNVLVFLKYHISYQFDVLTCITGVDYPNNKYRFKLVYELLSIKYNIRLRVKTFTHELFGVDSCDKLFFTAGWYECEI